MLALPIIVVFYFLMMMWILYHWLSDISTPGKEGQSKCSVSVIIPFRNEAQNLEFFLNQLMQQSENRNVEIILVDDHSEDGGPALISSFLEAHPGTIIRMLQMPEKRAGKKAALSIGVESSSGDVLLFTDADVVLPEGWLEGIQSVFSAQTEIKLFCGPVSIVFKNGFLSAFQSIEYGNLMVTGTGSFKAGFPLLASGANMAIRKEALKELGDDPWCSGLSSGDDVYLLQSTFRKFGKAAIWFSQDPELLVQAMPATGWHELFAQRLRWAGKTVSSGTGFTYLIGALVVLTNLIMVLSIPLAIYEILSWEMLAGIWGIKVCGETFIALVWSRFSGQGKALKWLPLMALVYPFINVMVFFLSLFIKPKWKGRKVVSWS